MSTPSPWSRRSTCRRAVAWLATLVLTASAGGASGIVGAGDALPRGAAAVGVPGPESGAADPGNDAGARTMTFEDVVSYRRVSEPRVSPDGRSVLFVVEETELGDNSTAESIWRYSVDGDRVARLTRPDDEQGSPRWSPDGDRFAFLSDRSGESQVWVMPASAGEARRATSHSTAVRSFEWSPDGRSIAYLAPEAPPPGKTARRDDGDDAWIYMEPRDRAVLWLLDPVTGETRRLLEAGLHVQELAWSPDGERLAVTARSSTAFDLSRETEIYLVDADAGGSARLTDNDVRESGLAWLPGGDAILYTAPHHSRFVNAESKLYRLELAADGGAGATERLAADHQYGLESAVVRPAANLALVASGVRASRRLLALDLDDGTVKPLGGLEEMDVTIVELDVSADGRTLAFVYTDTDSLPDVWMGSLGSATPGNGAPDDGDPGDRAPGAADVRRVTDLNPEARGWRLGETRVERWESDDGWEVEGLLTLPVDHRPGRRYPTMVVIHGGPEAAFTRSLRPSYMDYHQVLAGLGWAVLRPNYRGGSNYGDRFLQGMNADTGGGDYRDIMAGVDHLVEIGVADPDRLGVMGWSWGGISTGWIVTQTDRFAAASAGAMVSDHFSVFGQADLTYDVEYFYIGGSPWESPERYLRMSPIGHVMNAVTPTLLIHGEEDERCPLPQSVEFYKGLRAAGAETRLVVYPREPHVFREPRHRLDKMQRELRWFREHVLGE